MYAPEQADFEAPPIQISLLSMHFMTSSHRDLGKYEEPTVLAECLRLDENICAVLALLLCVKSQAEVELRWPGLDFDARRVISVLTHADSESIRRHPAGPGSTTSKS